MSTGNRCKLCIRASHRLGCIKKHKEEFVSWLRHRLLGIKLGNQLDALANGRSSTYLKYQGYEINGFTFYTTKQDGKSTYQNCGVRFDMGASLRSIEGNSFLLLVGLARGNQH